MKRLLLYLLPLLLTVPACTPDGGTDDDNATVDFDRREMLAGWVDNVIVPGYADLETELAAVNEATADFVGNPDVATKATLREAVHRANRAFQAIDPVLVGRAEEIRLREQLNTYPTDTELIGQNAVNGNANLTLPSTTAAQGFPALDYLLYGLEDAAFVSGDNATGYANYLTALVGRMQMLTAEAAAYWTEDRRAAFVANDGNSATASIDRTVNDFIFYYEKFLRAGKVGIPAGVFSDDPLADRVEARYSDRSDEYFFVALDATEDFFSTHGLADYLDAKGVRRNGELLSAQITAQFDLARTRARALATNFEQQVRTDNVKMLELYNALQRNVVLMKVDMLQALSINVDYVDADGD